MYVFALRNFEYFKNFFGEDVLVNIMNLGELNVLPTIEEAIDYNYFNIAVGILENEDIEKQITDYKTKLTQNKIDCNIYFFGDKVSSTVSYLILGVSAALLLGAYVLLNVLKKKDK